MKHNALIILLAMTMATASHAQTGWHFKESSIRETWTAA